MSLPFLCCWQDSYMNWVFKLKMTEDLSCTAVSEGLEAYMEPGYYPEGSDFDHGNLVYGKINDSGKLISEVSWDTDPLVVSEDYYTYSEDAGTVERETYELWANEEGLFELEVSRRNDVRDEEAVYFVQGEEGIFVMKILFPLSSSISSMGGVEGPEQVTASQEPLEFHVMEESLKKYTLSGTLNKLEAELEGEDFLRVHQSFLVNMRFIKSICRYSVVFTKSKGEEMEVSIPRARYNDVENRFISYRGEV